MLGPSVRRRHDESESSSGPFPRQFFTPGEASVARRIAVLLVVGAVALLAIESAGHPRPTVLFVGSSTIDRFPLAELFPGALCRNLGRGNEDAERLLERLPRVLRGPDPAGIVLYAGSADLRFDPSLGAAAIRARVDAVVSMLRDRFPRAPVLLIEVLPARAQSDDERADLRELNVALEGLARDRGVCFVRTNRAPLMDVRGDLAELMSVDRHHLSPEGYRVLAGWIRADGGEVGERLR